MKKLLMLSLLCSPLVAQSDVFTISPELIILKNIQQSTSAALLGLYSLQEYHQTVSDLLAQIERIIDQSVQANDTESIPKKSITCDSVNYDADKCGCHHNKPRVDRDGSIVCDKCGCHHKPKSE